MKIVAAKSILKANEQLAAENRARFDAAGVFCVNVVGSPGCGKTTLLEALLAEFRGRLAPAVIEGDIAGSIDAQRIEALGLPVVQINTDGACHLDANMIASSLGGFDLERIDVLFIENVGNLVCTAGFDLGEHLRIVVLSTSRGRRQGGEISGHLPGLRRLVHHEDRPVAARRFPRRADHGRHESDWPPRRRFGRFRPRRGGHPCGRRLAGPAVPDAEEGLGVARLAG